MHEKGGANKTRRKFPGSMPTEDLRICIVTWGQTVLLDSVDSVFFFNSYLLFWAAPIKQEMIIELLLCAWHCG